MKCFTCCFRNNSNHKKIITKKSCSNSSSSCNKISSISPQALQDLLETSENGEAFVAINDRNKEDDHHDEIVKSIKLIEESKEIISREDSLEFEENGDAINAKREEARHKIVNRINLFEESKDDEEEKEEEEEEEEEELNQSNRKNLLGTSKNGEDLLANQVSANCSNLNYQSNLQKQNGKEKEEPKEVSNSSVSSYISYPINHRYHSYDGFEDIDLKDEANNNGDGNEMIHEESSYESLFSLSIDDSTRKGNNPLFEIMCDKEEVNSPLKPTLLGRFQNPDGLVLDSPEVVHLSSMCNNSFKESEQHRLKQSIKFSANNQISQLSVFNPIRNPRLLNDTGITTPPSLLKQQEEKENVDTNLLDFGSTYNRAKKEPTLKREENEIGVDMSLSSWLVEFSQDNTPNSKNSDGSVGNSPSERRVGLIDRPILGALTVEEIKDEKAIVIGTVGSYLRHTGQATGISSS